LVEGKTSSLKNVRKKGRRKRNNYDNDNGRESEHMMVLGATFMEPFLHGDQVVTLNTKLP